MVTSRSNLTSSDRVFPEKVLRQYFEKADIDGDRRLSKPEVRDAFAKLGALLPCFRAHQAMARVDGNRDGYIDLDDNEQLDNLIKFARNLGYKSNTTIATEISP